MSSRWGAKRQLGSCDMWQCECTLESSPASPCLSTVHPHAEAGADCFASEGQAVIASLTAGTPYIVVETSLSWVLIFVAWCAHQREYRYICPLEMAFPDVQLPPKVHHHYVSRGWSEAWECYVTTSGSCWSSWGFWAACRSAALCLSTLSPITLSTLHRF